MLIDSHAHLNFDAFKDDLEKVIERCDKEDVSVINVGSNYETSKKAIEIAEKNKNMYAAIGLHPIHAKDEKFDAKKYKKLAKSNKVVAIGEIGIDYFKNYALFKDKQKEIFLEQLNLAEELNLPVIFHCRMAHNDLLDILEGRDIKGVIHCFTGTWKEAEKYISKGLFLGINGIIFKFDLEKVIRNVSLDNILIETDCPYLTPPVAGVERNEPIFIKYVVEKIAKIKKINFDEVASATIWNTRDLFNIK